jgi:hypothetical protein
VVLGEGGIFISRVCPVMEVNWLVSRDLFPGVRRLISSRRSDSSLHPLVLELRQHRHG